MGSDGGWALASSSVAQRPNKQKRQRQNRQAREARQARSAHAGEATSISRGDGGDGDEPTAETTSRRVTGKAAARSAARRPQPDRIPGQRAVLMAFLFAVVSAGTLLLFPVQVEREVDPDDPRVEEEFDEDEEIDLNEDGTVTILEDVRLVDEEGALVVAGIIGTPLLVTGAAVYFTKRPQRSTVYTFAMMALAAFIFLFAGPYGIIALPSMIALAVGGFQSRRADQRERMAEIRADREARDGDDDVIDVDAVDAEIEDPDGSDDRG